MFAASLACSDKVHGVIAGVSEDHRDLVCWFRDFISVSSVFSLSASLQHPPNVANEVINARGTILPSPLSVVFTLFNDTTHVLFCGSTLPGVKGIREATDILTVPRESPAIVAVRWEFPTRILNC